MESASAGHEYSSSVTASGRPNDTTKDLLMRVAMSFATVLALVLGFAPDASAQGRRSTLREIHRNHREGFWFAAGLGAGNEAFDLKGVTGGFGEDVTGPALTVKAGGTVSQNLVLGGELYAWTMNDDFDLDETLTSVMLIAQWYPAGRSGFFVKGGAGVAHFRQEVGGRFSFLVDEETGLGAVIGAGYDIRVGRNVSITPTIDLYGHTYNDWRERIVNLGVSVTFH